MQCMQAKAAGVQVGWFILEIAGTAVSDKATATTQLKAAITAGTPFEIMFAKPVCKLHFVR